MSTFKKTACTILVAAVLAAATPAEVEGQASAAELQRMRNEIARKEREIEQKQIQHNEKTEVAIRFDARYRPMVQQVLNRVAADELRNNGSRLWNSLIDQSLRERRLGVFGDFVPGEEGPELQRLQNVARDTHRTNMIEGSRQAVLDMGTESAGYKRFYLRHPRLEFENPLMLLGISMSEVRRRGGLRDTGMETTRVVDVRHEHQRTLLNNRIQSSINAKNALREQYRVARMTPAERAQHNRQMGW